MKALESPRTYWALALALALATALAWAGIVNWRPGSAGMGDGAMAPLPGPGALGLFLLMWTIMMVAMMFPAAMPMVLIFHRVSSDRRQKGVAAVPTWVFIAGYLAVWGAFGMIFYGLEGLLRWLVGASFGMARVPATITALAFLAAGIYQLTPLKTVCLQHCRSPLSFVMLHWREGTVGAVGMGVRHGAYCLGCCWALMLILLGVGVMNLAWMGLLTLLIFIEKIFPGGPLVGRVIGSGLIALGLLALVQPSLLPLLTLAP